MSKARRIRRRDKKLFGRIKQLNPDMSLDIKYFDLWGISGAEIIKEMLMPDKYAEPKDTGIMLMTEVN